MPKKKEVLDILSLEERKRFEEALAKRQKEMEPLIEAVRESQRITGEDLKIRINY